MSSRAAIAVALIAALSFPAPAFAAKKVDAKREAAKLARKAKVHYQRSQFLEAARLFLKAYELSKVSSQLRNAAKSFERANELDEALKQWERYRDLKSIKRDERLEAVANIDLIHEKKRKAEVEQAVEAARIAAEKAQLEAQAAKEAAVEAQRAPPPPPPVAPPPPIIVETAPPKDTGPSVGPWIVMAGGVAIGIASAIVWFVAQSRLNNLERQLGMRGLDGLITGTTFDDADATFSGINRDRTISGALLGTAIAVAAAGGLWLTLDYTLE